MDLALIILGQIAFIELLVIIFLLVLLSKKSRKPEKKELVKKEKLLVKPIKPIIVKSSKKRYKFKFKRIKNLWKIIAIIIPVLLVGFVLYSNFVASQDFNYFYDIGSEEDNYLSPANRISDKIVEDDINYRNLTSQLVYFNVPIPRGSDYISVETKIKTPVENQTISLGAQNKQEWSYYKKSIFSGLLESLNKPDYMGNDLTIYKLNKGFSSITNISDILSNSVVATDLNIPLKAKKDVQDIKPIEINTILRGGHTFYIYLKNSLDLYVEKQDLNWYNGTDEMNMNLYDINGNLITNATIPDDGISDNSKVKNSSISGTLKADNLNEGVYKLVFSDADALITKIKLNTNKIVTNKIFSADSKIYTNGFDKVSTFYIKSNKDSVVNFNTYHKDYLQNVSVNNQVVSMSQVNVAAQYPLTKQEYNIRTPKGDVIITSPSYISFSKDSYFEPFEFNVVQIPGSQDNLKGIDYIITGYSPVKKDNGWIITNTKFNIKDLYIKNDKLSLMFNVPYLSDNIDNANKQQVGIDWIKITVHKNGIF